jgi:hypothetical protein
MTSVGNCWSPASLAVLQFQRREVWGQLEFVYGWGRLCCFDGVQLHFWYVFCVSFWCSGGRSYLIDTVTCDKEYPLRIRAGLWERLGVSTCGGYSRTAPSSIVLFAAALFDCEEHTDFWPEEFVECVCGQLSDRKAWSVAVVYMELCVDIVVGYNPAWLGQRRLCLSGKCKSVGME